MHISQACGPPAGVQAFDIQSRAWLSQWEVKGHHLDCEVHTLVISLHCCPFIQMHCAFSHSQEESVCARTECGAGRECVPNNRGESVCRCLQVGLPVVTHKHNNINKPLQFQYPTSEAQTQKLKAQCANQYI